MVWSIMQYGKLNEAQKFQAVDIFIDGFGHFMTFTKDKKVLRMLFISAFHPVYTYVLLENETVTGILGIGTNKIRPVKVQKDICIDLFGGFKGKLICKEMNAIFQSQAVEHNRDLYIDVLATARHARGKGVATRLLKYCFNLQNYSTYYIEVMSKNTNARRLYEKIGFEECDKKRFSPLAFKGYGYPIKMVRKAGRQ